MILNPSYYAFPALRALARAVKSGDDFDWHAAKEQLSDLPDRDWAARDVTSLAATPLSRVYSRRR